MATIYKLYCIHTGEAYVGCTSGKLGKRMREHRCLLNKRNHSSKRMQELWNKHGSAGFRLESIEFLGHDVSVIEKRRHELRWMEFFDNKGLLLNHTKTSFAPPESARSEEAIEKMKAAKRGQKQTPESNKKRRLAQLGKPKPKHKKENCKICGRLISLSKMPQHLVACAKNRE